MTAAEADEIRTEGVSTAQESTNSLETAGEPSGEEPELDESAPSAANIEVITVKSGRPEEVSMETPSSVVAFDPKEIQELGAQSIADLARVTPNLEIKSLTASTPTFFIRGVGLNDFSANAAGAVAIYRDGVPINAPALQAAQLFDIAGVKILRGPQAFDDNRNASGGAIHTNSREPTGQYEAFLRADYGRYSATDFEGGLEVPLVTDWLAARGAFRVSERDPFYKNRCAGKVDTPGTDAAHVVCGEDFLNQNSGLINLVPPGLPDKVNDRDRWAWRGLLRLQPPESETDWLLNVHQGKLDEDSMLGQSIGTSVSGGGKVPVNSQNYIDPDIRNVFDRFLASLPIVPGTGSQRALLARQMTLDAVTRNIELAKPFQNDYDLVGKEEVRTLGTSLRGELPLGPVRATTITGWERFRRKRLQDYDDTPNPTVHIDLQDEAWQATENLGFEWEPPPEWFLGTVRWGGFYLREKLESDGAFLLQLFNANTSRIFQTFEQDYDSAGVFGNFSWDLFDDFTLDGGVRFNWEKKTFEMVAESELALAFSRSQPVSLDETWSAPTGGIGLTYYFARDVTAYAKYTRGWKGGQIQGNSLRTIIQAEPITATPTVAEPETIDAFEVGFNGRWLDDRLRIGGALFHYSYQDYQVFVTESTAGSVPVLKVINANDARLFGAELDFRITPLAGWADTALDDFSRWSGAPRFLPPVEGLALSGRFGWIESEFLDFSDTRIKINTVGNGTQTVAIPTVVDFTGNSLPNTPRYKVSGTVEYRFDLGRWGTPAVRYDVNWTDDIFFDPSQGRGVTGNPFFGKPPLPKYAIGQRAYALHDIRVSYLLPSGKIEVAFWIRNFTNETYKTFVSDTVVAFDSLQNLVGDPRTYGGSFSVFF